MFSVLGIVGRQAQVFHRLTVRSTARSTCIVSTGQSLLADGGVDIFGCAS